MNKQYTKAQVESVENGEIIAIASTDNPDRDGDVLKVEGWELAKYKKAPRLLWGHDANAFPIGRVKKIWKDGGSLKFIPQFMPADMNPFAEKVEKAMKSNPPFIDTFSVGFIPKKQDKDDNWVKQELLEISVVNIPANSDAQVVRDFKSLDDESKNIKNLDNKNIENWIDQKEVKQIEKKEVKEEVKEEAKPKKVESTEVTKNMIRNAIDTSKQSQQALEGVLETLESPKSEKGIEKVVVKADSSKQVERKAAKVIARASEILLTSYKK